MRWIALALVALVGCSGSTIGSIGAVLVRDNDNGDVVVKEVPPGLAADKGGLVAGDRILMIDGVYVGKLDPAALRQRLRGDVGQPVELTIVHGAGVRRVKLVRTALKADAKPPPPKETRLAE